jgi:hypothetical protein
MTPNDETVITDTSKVVEFADEIPGATLVLDSSEFEPVDLQAPPVPGKKIPMTKDAILAFISQMVGSGEITTHQAADIRRRFGIAGSVFTKKKVSREKKNRRKKIAQTSRVKNRYNNSTKGQTRTLNLAK